MTTVAIIGGTGPQGKGLGYRFAQGGYDVMLGSRDESRAIEATIPLNRRLEGHRSGALTGATNAKAAGAADLVLLAVPYEGHAALVTELQDELEGKILISCVNPLGFDGRGPYGLDLGADSAAEATQRALPSSRVVGAFHHLSAATLISGVPVLDHEDVLVCGDDPDAKSVVMELATTVTGKPGIDAGPLRLARHLEPLTAVLISVNKRYKVRAGIAITGIPTTVAHLNE